MGESGLDPARAVEVIVTLPDGSGRRGSGYRVSGTAVLTAAHVVAGAAAVRVRCNADTEDEWTSDADVHVLHEPSDLAVLGVERADEPPHVLYGGIRARDAVVACTGLGFPRFKLRDDGVSSYRDLCHLVGSAPVLSNRRSGTLEITVTAPPERDPDPRRSAWEGMSGAPVFARGRLIAVVTGNHPPEGVGRLEATRLDGIKDRALREALRIPPELPDVLPVEPRSLELAAHRAEVASIAPEYLSGREEELAELVGFCSGEEPYLWWQAGPWAGKTALASSFAVDPPVGVRIASFFVTARLAGQADAAAFTSAMVRQLSEIAELGEQVVSVRNPLPLLVGEAAARCAERGERLLLLVDGLDEDRGHRPSIASLLPNRPPNNVRVLVLSRPHPGLPDDVRGDHPLRHCRVRELARSDYARFLEFSAREELKELIESGDEGYEVVALITACGGGLTIADLAELTGRRHHEIAWHIRGVFGRSLTARSRDTGQVYLFAHETLRETAERTLAYELPRYRDRLHAWADRYREQGWPEGTPTYLLAPYTRLLAALGDTGRLAALAADPRRHDRMLRLTRTDQAALDEIEQAQRLLATGNALTPMVLIGLERQRLTERSQELPQRLAALWARLGYFAHAAGLSRFAYEEGLAEYGLALVEAGRYEQAEEVARRSRDYEMLSVWTALLAALRHTPERDRLLAGILRHLDELLSFALFSDRFTEVLKLLDRVDRTAFAEAAARIDRLIVEAELGVREVVTLTPAIARYAPERAERLLQQAIEEFRNGDPTTRRLMIVPLVTTLVTMGGAPEDGDQVTEEAESWAAGAEPVVTFAERAVLTAAVLDRDPDRGLALVERLYGAHGDANWAEEPEAWTELVSALARSAGVDRVRALVTAEGLDPASRARGIAVLVAEGRFAEPRQALDLAAHAAQAAREAAASADLLVETAAAVLRFDRELAAELALEAERAVGDATLLGGEWIRERLVEALVRSGRPGEAEQLLGSPGPLLADIAREYARTSPADAERIVASVPDQGRWPGQDRKKITAADRAKLSAALHASRPGAADAMAVRAIDRVLEGGDDDVRFGKILELAANLTRERAVPLIDFARGLLAEGVPRSGSPARLARILLRFDREGAARLVDRDPGELDTMDQRVDRLAVYAVVAPDRAAAFAEDLMRNSEDQGWLAADVASALLGDRDTPGDPSLRPLAARWVRTALLDGDWSDALPSVVDLEPEALDATLKWCRDLGVL